MSHLNNFLVLIVILNCLKSFNCMDYFVSSPEDLLFIGEDLQTLEKIRVARQVNQNNRRTVKNGNNWNSMGQGMNGNSQQNKFNSGQGANGQTSSTGGTSMMTQNGQSTRGNRQMAPINNGKGNYPQGNQMNGQTNGQNFGPVNNNGINSPPQQGINQNSNMRPMTGIPGQNNNMQVTKSPTNSGQQLYRLQNRRIG